MKIVSLIVALVLVAGSVAAEVPPLRVDPDTRSEVASWVDAALPSLVSTYEHLHAHPELSREEKETAAFIAAALRDSGYAVHEGVGGFGVVGVLENGSGPKLLLRGDTDGLPVTEETGLAYASQVTAERPDGSVSGVMHACGHDLHITNLLGTARFLAEHRDRWQGTLLVVAQPAEEVGEGAKAMLEDGFEKRFGRPDYALALHAEAELPAGDIGLVSGFAAANVDSVDITIFGRGGHGARPHQTVDPIVVASHVVVALQTIVSRRVDPLERAVVTVGSFHAGFKHNVIPDEAHLQLTVRSYKDDVRERLLGSIRQIATDTCRTFECPKPPDVKVKEAFTPSSYNDPKLTQEAAGVFELLLGAERVHTMNPSMGGEDFGRYSRAFRIPALQFRLGSVAPEQYVASLRDQKKLPSLHSSRYAPLPGPTLKTAVTTTANLVCALLPPQ